MKNKINSFTLLFFNSQKQFYIKVQFFYAFLNITNVNITFILHTITSALNKITENKN